MRTVHLSYATANFSQAVKFLQKSAGRFDLDSRLYTPEHPVLVDLMQKHPSIMAAPRGAGYWLWKPFIILNVLNSVPDGTPVLYTDVAMTFIADPTPLTSLAKQHPVCLFKMSGPPMLQGTWTKRDCFVEMGADTEEFWSLPQLLGGIQLYRAGLCRCLRKRWPARRASPTSRISTACQTCRTSSTTGMISPY